MTHYQMSIISEVTIPAHEFELGRILDMEDGTTIELEEMVPLDETAVPFFSVHDQTRSAFEERVRDHPSVDRIQAVNRPDDQTTVYSLNWNHETDLVFQGILSVDAHVLSATGHAIDWEFELQFPDHGALREFETYCADANISVTMDRVYNPTSPENAAWFGLTEVQRETLVYAVEHGYYDIPREISTKEMAEEFGVSDQAITERLRRATRALAGNTLGMAAPAAD